MGFFFHDYVGILKDIINSYDWATCRVQHSYLGENCQAGKEGLRYAASEEIGVVIMESLRGGRLTDKIPEEVQRVWDLTRQGRTPAEWELGWVWNHPRGFNGPQRNEPLAQLKEYIRIAEDTRPHSPSLEEIETIRKVADIYRRLLKVDCTGCAYCVPCPHGVNIAVNFTPYNDYHMLKYREVSQAFYNGRMLPERKTSNCEECGECEQQCPRQTEIIEALKKVDDQLRPKGVPGHK
ncbi:MAG: 4Fe-4S dicluster domain-containing protein [Thermodesulfobacteriota bacterium]